MIPQISSLMMKILMFSPKRTKRMSMQSYSRIGDFREPFFSYWIAFLLFSLSLSFIFYLSFLFPSFLLIVSFSIPPPFFFPVGRPGLVLERKKERKKERKTERKKNTAASAFMSQRSIFTHLSMYDLSIKLRKHSRREREDKQRIKAQKRPKGQRYPKEQRRQQRSHPCRQQKGTPAKAPPPAAGDAFPGNTPPAPGSPPPAGCT